eukprot:7878522-Pyramimonas_sp.AAC.1
MVGSSFSSLSEPGRCARSLALSYVAPLHARPRRQKSIWLYGQELLLSVSIRDFCPTNIGAKR